jgi:hypothetical protein
MSFAKIPKDIFDQVSAMANSDFEDAREVFTLLPSKDVFAFSYIHGYRDVYVSYIHEECETSEVNIGDIVAEIPSDILTDATTGAEKGFKKYEDKIKSMQLKDIYKLGFQSGYVDGFDIYSDKDFGKKDIPETIKFYHANFEKLH